MKIHTLSLTVTENHLDSNMHVNNLEYLRWAHKISSLHWKSVATPLLQEEYTWVIARNEIDYFRELFLGDEIEIKTWIEKTVKAKSYRIIEIYNKSKNEMAAKAMVIWYALEASTRRPKRISEEINQLFGVV
jgi:acyl-CoA thioester hydrolase